MSGQMGYREMADSVARITALRYLMDELDRLNFCRPRNYEQIHECAKLIRREAARLANDTPPQERG